MRLSPLHSIGIMGGSNHQILFAEGRLAEERSDGVRAEPKASLKQRVPPLPWGLAWGEGSGVGGTDAGAPILDYISGELMI